MEIDMTYNHVARLTLDLNHAADAISALTIGDGVTVSLWTDCEAYTIIKQTPTTMTLQLDKATLSPEFQPEIIPGGFAGHCVNQQDQTYTYERDADGRTIKISLRRWKDEEGNERRKWKRTGSGTFEAGNNAYAGRRKFHDYNF
jgi:hypothetical protein